MATWVTHLMIADQIMKKAKGLDRRGFCVGNIAPDCNVENEDWTSFIPSREITHWMKGEGKSVSDGDLFYEEYMQKRESEIKSEEHRAFLAGYYSHLITDAVFQKFIRDENRVKAVWRRIYADEQLREKVKCYPEDWNSVRIIIPKNIRMAEINTMEAEYLKEHPDSGYDYLPHNCIVRKIRIMGQIPEVDVNIMNPITISREEHQLFVDHTAELVLRRLREKGCVSFVPGNWEGTVF